MKENTTIRTIPYYMIVNKCSGMALDVMDDCARVFFPMGTALQSWCFEDVGDGYITIMNRNTHKVLDVEMAGMDNGSPVHMWSSVRAQNQQWAIEPAGKGVFRIRARQSGRCLDLIDQSLDARAQLNIWEKTTSETQLWIITPILEGEAIAPVVEEQPEAESPKKTRRPRGSVKTPAAAPKKTRTRRTKAAIEAERAAAAAEPEQKEEPKE